MVTTTGMHTTITSTSSTTKSQSFFIFLNDFQTSFCFYVIIVPICQLQFEAISIIRPYSGFSNLKSLIVDDFNRDGLLDITFFSSVDSRIHILFGHGNGTFGTFSVSFMIYVGFFGGMTVADFNDDNQLDIALTDFYFDCVHILLGDVNGTFENRMLCIGLGSYFNQIDTADFNGDNYIDIVVVNSVTSEIAVLLGNNNGDFSMQSILSTGKDTFTTSIATTDFNSDNYSDIVAVNFLDKNIGVFFGHGDGTFDIQNTFFTGGGIHPIYIAVGDFNNMTHLKMWFFPTMTRKSV